MTPEKILEFPGQVLDDSQRRSYFEHGYLHLEAFLPEDVLARLRAAYDELVERYRYQVVSDDDVLIEADHTPENPRFKRINRATDQHKTLWLMRRTRCLPSWSQIWWVRRCGFASLTSTASHLTVEMRLIGIRISPFFLTRIRRC